MNKNKPVGITHVFRKIEETERLFTVCYCVGTNNPVPEKPIHIMSFNQDTGYNKIFVDNVARLKLGETYFYKEKNNLQTITRVK